MSLIFNIIHMNKTPDAAEREAEQQRSLTEISNKLADMLPKFPDGEEAINDCDGNKYRVKLLRNR